MKFIRMGSMQSRPEKGWKKYTKKKGFMDYHKYGHNVKVYNYPKVEDQEILSDQEMDWAYYGTVEAFWDDLSQQTKEKFGEDVYSEGRSGGWAVYGNGEEEAPQEWHELVAELVDAYSTVFWEDQIQFYVDEKKAELNSCDLFKAANHVKDNIGEPVAIVKIRDNEYFAIACRYHAPFKYQEYSTHWVYPRGCESGTYDLTEKQAYSHLENTISNTKTGEE